MLTLYALGDELEAIYATLAENGGEITEELAARLDAVAGDFNEKAERTALMIKQMQAQAEVVSTEAKRLIARASALGKGADGLKGYLQAQMRRVEKTEVKGALVTIRVQKSPPSAVCLLPPDKVADIASDEAYAAFFEEIPATIRFDAKAAIAAYRAGTGLPEGIVVGQSTHLRLY